MKTLILLITFLISTSLWANDLTENDFQWEIASQTDDIIVYKAPKHESGVVPIKGQTVFNHSISDILSLIADTPKKINWVPYLKESYLVDAENPFRRVEYARYNSPWPFEDRVFVLSIEGDYDKEKKEVFIALKSVDHPKFPKNEDSVRGMTYYGAIRIKDLGVNKTFFEIVLLSDFAGNVPHWIVNMVQAKWPFKMFKQMRDELTRPGFQLNPDYELQNILKAVKRAK